MTECAKCGDCCENIYIGLTPPDITRMLADPYIAGATRRSLEFVQHHWSLLWQSGQGRGYECDMFDKVSRLCTAHDSRPPICQGYPWYGKKPDRELVKDMSPRCSFNADVRTMLPIVSVNGKEL